MTTRIYSSIAAIAAVLAGTISISWGLRPALAQTEGSVASNRLVLNQQNAASDNDPFAPAGANVADVTAEDTTDAVPGVDVAGGAATPQWDVTVTSEDSNYNVVPRSQAEIAMRTRLAEPVQLQYLDAPLADVVDDLSRRLEVHIEIDRRALEDLGIDASMPVTANFRGISLHSALKLMFQQHELTYIIEGDYLLITTIDEAEQRLDTRVYPIRRQWNASGEELVQAIAIIASPLSWEINGGPGSIVELGSNLIIHQTERVHAEIKDLLRQIDTAARLEDGQ